MKAPWTPRVAWVLVIASFAFSLARIPHATWGKRLAQVREFEQLGAAGYHLGRTWPDELRIVEWIEANTPSDAVVLWRGTWQGPIEHVVASIGDRLLFDADVAGGIPGSETQLLGRPVARGSFEGKTGRVVLIATRESLSMEIVP
ncbi:MAG: hypothetical protein KDC95_00270 [Planctomycetes bacterium]|nr:hypothetical protein [Planctomycetota bacterium]